MPMPSPLALIHVVGAVLGLISGFLAMFFRKGSGLHAAAGTIFFGSMMSMSSAGAVMALVTRPNKGNLMGATLTLYLVATAWVAARRRERRTGAFDVIALLLALAVAGWGATWGMVAARRATGIDGYAASLFFVFASIAFLFAVSDVRMILRGGVAGTKRIARHLWRMGLALVFTTLSFYPGQARLFSRAVRQTNLMYIPLVVAAGLTLFWLFRVRFPNAGRFRRPAPNAPQFPAGAAAVVVTRSEGSYER